MKKNIIGKVMVVLALLVTVISFSACSEEDNAVPKTEFPSIDVVDDHISQSEAE